MEQALFLITFLTAQGENYAAQQATLAYIKQNRIDQMLDDYQRTLLSKRARYYVGNTAIIAQAAIEQKVIFTWSF